MALASRIYFNAVFGGLGALFGWMLFGILGDANPSSQRAFLMFTHEDTNLFLGGALIGGMIGYFPTYTLGNVISAQLFERARAEVPPMGLGARLGEQVARALCERFVRVMLLLEQHRGDERRHHQQLVRIPHDRVRALDPAQRVRLVPLLTRQKSIGLFGSCRWRELERRIGQLGIDDHLLHEPVEDARTALGDVLRERLAQVAAAANAFSSRSIFGPAAQ